MYLSKSLVISLIFLIGIFYRLHLSKSLLYKTCMTKSGVFSMAISFLVLLFIVSRVRENNLDYILLVIGLVLAYLTIVTGGITEDGFKSVQKFNKTSQYWEGISRVEISIDEYVKVYYVGKREAAVLNFKKEDYIKIAKLLNEKLGEHTEIVMR